MGKDPKTTPTGETDSELGIRIKHLRMSRGLRMREVAKQAACSESMVSKIEAGHTVPSLRVLHSIAHALDVSIASLFETPKAAGIVRRAGERPMIRLKGANYSGQIALEGLAPTEQNALLEANIHIVEPGAESDGAISHEGEELGLVIEGCLELQVDDETFFLQTGDSFWFPSNRKHRYRNPGRTTARIVWVNTPPTF
ncbi:MULTISPECIES: cupin domain-containing protein [Halomonas]|uniref:Cupin domain-containing protein n=1 Tax=Halomonas flagellata TaxID=2920385 RepID=A0ABS9RWZ9_9GAMM|nr:MULTISPECIES: cupin domain-containing protein [Halomonas]MCH4564329.1 cupin domain-containing protein [Halomonas flagellata]PXY00329.1 XRE family transcriptional regulator [Halomonas sp. LBP4]